MQLHRKCVSAAVYFPEGNLIVNYICEDTRGASLAPGQMSEELLFVCISDSPSVSPANLCCVVVSTQVSQQHVRLHKLHSVDISSAESARFVWSSQGHR